MAGGGEVLAAERGSWEVEFSRFFNFPRLPSPSCVDIKPLPKCKGRSRGTWVSASSSSSLSLSLVPNAPPILLVSIPHCIFDEHFVSNLYFSWPQVSCSTECPIRRSRVVFVSYRDCHDQIQKFALRFSSGNEAQAFFDAVKFSLFLKSCWKKYHVLLLAIS